MADKLDPFDVGALEGSVNNSAGQVSAVWLGFVAFSAYLAAAVSNVSHRQLFLEDTIKLPTINIDLPLFASALLLPAIFVIYHVYVLLQVVLLARTAAAYNDAVERAIADLDDRSRVRQRLANTLFAQIFAGSPREREGFLGGLLRSMAWVTLAIAPPLVLLLFEIKFLPYHSFTVTWTHRLLITGDLLAVVLLWAGAIAPGGDITWRSLLRHPNLTAGAACIVALTWITITFPGEPNRIWMRPFASDEGQPACWTPKFISAVLPDRLSLLGDTFVDTDKLAKIVAVARTNGQKAHESERTYSLRDRDLLCGQFAGADLRHADFSGANLQEASFRGARLEGARFSGALLQGASFDGAQLQEASFAGDEKRADGPVGPARAQAASLREAQLSGATLEKAQFQGAHFEKAQLAGAILIGAALQGTSFTSASLLGATLDQALLQGAHISTADVRGASFDDASLHGALLNSGQFTNVNFDGAKLYAARFDGSRLTLARFRNAFIWNAIRRRCQDAEVRDPKFDAVSDDKDKPIESEEALDRLIEQTIAGAIPTVAERLRTELRTRLSGRETKIFEEQSKKEWLACAANPPPEEDINAKRAALLIALACDPPVSGAYVAEGIHRNWWVHLQGARE